jgi:CRISPR-associated protein Csh1
MLEGVRVIGEAALERTPLLEALVDKRLLEQATQTGKEREGGLIATLDIHLDPPRLVVDLNPIDEKSLVEVLWVENAAGSNNSPQDRLTTDNPTYLASQTVPNLLKALPKDGSLAVKLRTLREAAYIDLGEKGELFPNGGGDQQYERYRRVWDLHKLGLDPASALDLLSRKGEREEAERLCAQEGVEFLSKEFLRAYARTKGSAKEAIRLVGQVLQNWVSKELDVKGSQIKLYTLALDGERLVRHPDYVQYIERKLVDEAFEGPEASKGVCHVCGTQGSITANTTRFDLLTFYNTDKPGFSGNILGRKKGGFLRNYTLCRECYQALLAGEQFLKNELHTRLGRSNVYVIPVFHVPEVLPDAQTLDKWAQYLKQRLAAAETIEGWHNFQQQLERYQRQEEGKAAFVLNLLFATKIRAAVKVDKLIVDVPPSRLDRIDDARRWVYDWAADHLGERNEWDLGLGRLFYLLPLRQRDRQVEAKPYLELLDALLTGRPLSARALIPLLLETAAIHRFERYQAHVHNRPNDPERALVVHLLQAQLFLRYLKDFERLGAASRLDEGGEMMIEEIAKMKEEELLDGDLRIWMDGLRLEGAQRGLFLLGVLIGQIGSTREQIDSRKPILNKVNFQGMDRPKIVRLANEVYEKLRQYKIADYKEGTYCVMRDYLDQPLNDNKNTFGSPQENVYWVLSGYAYATQQAIRAGRPKRQSEAEAETEPLPEGAEVPE